MATVATVWTHNQFIDGTTIKGHALGFKIAAGNVPSFVDRQTGGWGATIQDPLNGRKTPTMANFAMLADVLEGCATQVTASACGMMFAAATPPQGRAPTVTLMAAESIAGYPWYEPERGFLLLNQFYRFLKARRCGRCRHAGALPSVSCRGSLPLARETGTEHAGEL